LESILDLLQEKFNEELQARLRNHDKGVFPSKQLTALSSKSIDLLSAIEKLLEPGQLVQADHFLGKANDFCCPWHIHD
jgi:hypothetical protein